MRTQGLLLQLMLDFCHALVPLSPCAARCVFAIYWIVRGVPQTCETHFSCNNAGEGCLMIFAIELKPGIQPILDFLDTWLV